MAKKFKLTEETKELHGIKLYRIEALINFGGVKAGEKGGYVQKEENLDQSDNAWVSDDAQVFGDAWVSGDAQISGNALVDCTNKLITISPIGSESGVLTAFKQKDNSIMVNRGCFTGVLDTFSEAVSKKHGDNEHGQIYKLAIEMIKLRLCSGDK